MLPNASIDGLDLFAAMADQAAARATGQLHGDIRLAKCTNFELTEGFGPEDVDLETWPVVVEREAVTISVFATSRRKDGARQMAGSGRFTFTLHGASSNSARRA
ncbi:MAG: hypothetical protein QM690_01425 [Sphingobium sp.]